MSKRAHYIITFSVGIITLLSVVFYSSACKKNKDCKATVRVSDASTGGPVLGVLVTLSPTQTAPQGNLSIQTQSGTTDGSGSVSFTFKLPAILQVSVKPPAPYTTCASCPALIHLEEGKTVTQAIKVN
jgi:hypothetical protein